MSVSGAERKKDSAHLYVVDGMDVVHTIFYDSSDLLQTLIWAHGSNSVT